MANVDEGDEKIEAVEVLVGEDVILLIVVLGHDDLFCPEEGPEVVVEVHFLVVAFRVVADPQALGVGFEPDVEESEGEEEEDGDGAGDDDGPVVEAEPAQFLEDDFKVHQ